MSTEDKYYTVGIRQTTVELLDKLLRMGYSEDEAKAYIKTGDIDTLGKRRSVSLEYDPTDGTETR